MRLRGLSALIGIVFLAGLVGYTMYAYALWYNAEDRGTIIDKGWEVKSCANNSSVVEYWVKVEA